MVVLALHADAKADLESMTPRDKALIAVYLQEVESDPNLAANLTDHRFGENPRGVYAVRKWTRLWNQGLDIWRLRLWKAESLGLNYRIVYAYLPTQQRFNVLAIVPRDQFDYDDPNHHLAVRIRAAYDGL